MMEKSKDLISRADAIEAVFAVSRRVPTMAIRAKDALESLPSASVEVDEWIPCSERLPKELEAVNVTWVNHNPPCYYMDIMNVPFTATGVYHEGKWYWWDATVIDLLGEYGGAYVHGIEPIDKYIEITAWMPLPKPYEGSESDE